MVFLAITPSRLTEALREAENLGASVWCGSDALSELDFAEQGARKLTRFAYALGARDPLVLEGALDTIGQHHPGEFVWVEAAAQVC